MRKKFITAIFVLCLLLLSLFLIFNYYFFIKPISREEAGINKYATLLTIENRTNSKMFIVLNFNFSNKEFQKFKDFAYIETNNYFTRDTIKLGAVSDYSNFENFEFSGFVEKPQIVPEDFSLKILDSSKHVLKFWDKINFEKKIRLKNNERKITITSNKNHIIIE